MDGKKHKFLKKQIVVGAVVTIALLLTVLFFAIRGVTSYRLSQRQNSIMERVEQTDPHSAIKILQKFFAEDPGNEKVLVKIAELHENLDEWRRAAGTWQHATRLHPFKIKYKKSFINALHRSRAYGDLARDFPEILPDPEADDQLLYAYALHGIGKKKEAAAALAKVKMSGSRYDFVRGCIDGKWSAARNVKARDMDELRRFSTASEEDVRLEALLLLGRMADTANHVQEAQRVLEAAAELNPEYTLPLLADFYYRHLDTAKAAAIYARIADAGDLPSGLAVRYGELLCLQNKTEELQKLARKYHRGSADDLKNGIYIDLLVDFLRGKYRKETVDAVRRMDIAAYSPLSYIVLIAAAVERGDTEWIGLLLQKLAATPSAATLRTELSRQLEPLLNKLYMAKKIDQAAVVAENLWMMKDRSLLVLRIVLLDRMQRNSLDPILLQEALKLYPQDRLILEIAALNAMHSGAFAAMLDYVERSLAAGHRGDDLTLYRIFALEGCGRKDAAARAFAALPEKKLAEDRMFKTYLAFCLRNDRINALRMLPANVRKEAWRSNYLDGVIAYHDRNADACAAALFKSVADGTLSPKVAEDIELISNRGAYLAAIGAFPEAIGEYNKILSVHPNRALLEGIIYDLAAKNKRKSAK